MAFYMQELCGELESINLLSPVHIYTNKVSQNVGKLFSKLYLVTDKLLIYAECN